MEKHFTATAYIVARISGQVKVLLHNLKRHNLGCQWGGHIEETGTPVEAVLREVKEETNLEISFIKAKLLKTDAVEQLHSPETILVEKLKPYKREGAHYHIDLIYFAFCKNPENLKMPEEHGWFSLMDLIRLPLTPEVKLLAKKVLNYFGQSA